MAERRPDWHRWYRRPEWQAIRREVLTRDGYACVRCGRGWRGPRSLAVDHVEPHRGDWEKFLAGPFQTLCATCHAAAKQAEERAGRSLAVGPDGWPVGGGEIVGAGRAATGGGAGGKLRGKLKGKATG